MGVFEAALEDAEDGLEAAETFDEADVEADDEDEAEVEAEDEADGLMVTGIAEATERAVHYPLMQPYPTSQTHSFPLKNAFLGQETFALELLVENEAQDKADEDEADEAKDKADEAKDEAEAQDKADEDEANEAKDEAEDDEDEADDEAEAEDVAEAEAETAVPRQATPPSLKVLGVVPRGHELRQLFPQTTLLAPHAAQSLAGAFPAAIQTSPSESKFLEAERESWKSSEI